MDFQKIVGAELPMSPASAALLSPTLLAYIGDAVYELIIRSAGLQSGLSAERLHRVVVQWVCAEGQGRLLDRVEGTLTSEEAAIARRGRNAKTTLPQRTSPAAYRRSTAFEALIGYLYVIGDQQRIGQLLAPVVDAVRAGRGPDD